MLPNAEMIKLWFKPGKSKNEWADFKEIWYYYVIFFILNTCGALLGLFSFHPI